MKSNRSHFVAAFVTLIAFLMLASAAHAGRGAIFTTDRDGTVVNGNIYEDCCDVFLNGGPPPNAPCWAAGLPDGEYYFQVTDPSGSVLLSSDDIEQRRFRVEGGLIVEYLGTSGECSHETGLGKCHQTNANNISVQLMPFDPTPNPGGVYKVWVTPVNKYNPNAPNSNFGFVPSACKTDNFKCETEEPPPPPPPAECIIRILKYDDVNGNGVNEDELPMNGVAFDVCYTPPGGEQTCVTVVSGSWMWGIARVIVPAGSEVLICEQVPVEPTGACTWMQTEPHAQSANGVFMNGQWCYLLHCPDEPFTTWVEFGNVCMNPISGGRTTASWTQSAGKTRLKTNNPAWRSALNPLYLRNSTGSNRDFKYTAFDKNYAALRTWLSSASTSNMAYALSRQVAATTLSVKFNGLDREARIMIGDSTAAKLGIDYNAVRIADLLSWSNWALKAQSNTTQASEWRTRQATLAKLLAKINANQVYRTVPDAGIGY